MKNDEIVEKINTITDGMTAIHYGVEDLLEIKRLASQLTVSPMNVPCPYCDEPRWEAAKPLVDSGYESCNLAVENNHWLIQVWGDDKGEEPVSYCPMCGRYLGDEVDEDD